QGPSTNEIGARAVFHDADLAVGTRERDLTLLLTGLEELAPRGQRAPAVRRDQEVVDLEADESLAADAEETRGGGVRVDVAAVVVRDDHGFERAVEERLDLPMRRRELGLGACAFDA